MGGGDRGEVFRRVHSNMPVIKCLILVVYYILFLFIQATFKSAFPPLVVLDSKPNLIKIKQKHAESNGSYIHRKFEAVAGCESKP